MYRGDHSSPAIVFGAGQAQSARRFTLLLESYPAHPKLHPEESIGIGISGGGSGAHMTLIQDVEVRGFRHGAVTGWNSDSLGDSNVFDRFQASFCDVAVQIRETQNYINDFYSCVLGGRVGIQSYVGKNVNVNGGNVSHTNSLRRMMPVVANSVAVVPTPVYEPGVGDPLVARVTFRVDPNARDDTFDALAQALVYDVAAVRTEAFGYVPLQVESFDAASGTLTMHVAPWWSVWFYSFPGLSLAGCELLRAEIEAVGHVALTA